MERSSCPSTTYPASKPSISFTAHGTPGPKGSRNVGKHGQSYDQSRVGKQWQSDVALQARSALIRYGVKGPLPKPYHVEVVFAFPWPRQATHQWPSKADIDKLVRATLDGLTQGGVIEDDRHVISLVSVKRFSDDPYAHIHVASTEPL